jgi:hypothetical protein
MDIKPFLVLVIFLGAVGIVAIAVPIYTETDVEEVFTYDDDTLRDGYFTWTHPEVQEDSELWVNFQADKDVCVYIFTENQFTNWKNTNDDVYLDAVKWVRTGSVRCTAQETGELFFVVYYSGEPNYAKVSAQGRIVTNYRITIYQKFFGN